MSYIRDRFPKIKCQEKLKGRNMLSFEIGSARNKTKPMSIRKNVNELSNV